MANQNLSNTKVSKEEISNKLQELQTVIKDCCQKLPSFFDQQTKICQDNNNYFYKSQLQYAEECDVLFQELRASKPTNQFTDNNNSYRFDIRFHQKKVNLFSGLNKYCKPIFMDDELPPSPSGYIIPVIVPEENYAQARIPLSGLDNVNYRNRPEMFPSNAEESYDEDEEEEKRSLSVEQVKEDAKSSIVSEKSIIESNNLDESIIEITIKSRPLNLVMDSRKMLVKGVMDGEGKRAGVEVGDVFHQVNDMPATMILLSQEELPLRVLVKRKQ